MKVPGISSRRSLVSLCVVSCAVLVAALSAAGAVGTRYFKDLGGADLTVQVSDKGVFFDTYGAPIKCSKYIPL